MTYLQIELSTWACEYHEAEITFPPGNAADHKQVSHFVWHVPGYLMRCIRGGIEKLTWVSMLTLTKLGTRKRSCEVKVVLILAASSIGS